MSALRNSLQGEPMSATTHEAERERQWAQAWGAHMAALRGAMHWRPSDEPDPFAVRVIV